MRIIGIVSVLLVAGGGNGLLARERVTVKMLPEQGTTCGEILVARPWAVPSYDTTRRYFGFDGKYFTRDLAQFDLHQGESLLLLGVSSLKSPRGPFVSSPERYAVVQEGPNFVLRSATDAEWESARELAHSMRPASGRAQDGKPLSYAGQVFTPSGKNWWLSINNSSLISADQAHLALFTWDGTVRYGTPFSSFPWPFESTRKDGHFFIDIYQTATGRKDAVIRGTFHDVEPGALFSHSFWLEGSRFIMPLDEHMQRLVLCEIR
jgi:hypothetical protein